MAGDHPAGTSIVLRFDMRSSPDCSEPQTARYQAAIDMARWADGNRVDVVGLSEHHSTTDGYLSAPLGLAGMMAAVTERVRISVSALLVPLHDPLRVAKPAPVRATGTAPPARQRPAWQDSVICKAVHCLGQHAAADQLFHDLAGASVDTLDTRINIGSGHPVFTHKAVATM